MENEVKRPSAGSGATAHRRLNAGKLTGQKPALKMKEVWSIRTRLELDGDVRNLVVFNLAIDSKLRGCDLVRLKVGDVAERHNGWNAGGRCRAGSAAGGVRIQCVPGATWSNMLVNCASVDWSKTHKP